MMKYLLGLALVLCTACAPAMRGPAVSPSATLALASFVVPQNNWELMAGVLPEERPAVDAESLEALDDALVRLLEARGNTRLMRAAMVRQCTEVVLATKERKRFEAVEYWKQVGQCMEADYLLVPFILHWQERDGGKWGVNRPASVMVDLFLVEVASGQVQRFHFEEEQQGLAENLLTSKRFFKRKGRWLTPFELTLEALEDGVGALGL